jgi:predicted nucleotidyltransferase
LLTEIRQRLEQARGERLKGVVLYGSVARGEESEQSDIDLLYEADTSS